MKRKYIDSYVRVMNNVTMSDEEKKYVTDIIKQS